MHFETVEVSNSPSVGPAFTIPNLVKLWINSSNDVVLLLIWFGLRPSLIAGGPTCDLTPEEDPKTEARQTLGANSMISSHNFALGA